MVQPWNALGFIAKSATVGLAVAFLAVLVDPALVNWERRASRPAVSSFSEAVAASSPAVANVFTDRNLALGMSRRRTSAPVAVRGRGLGSAVVMSRDGYLVTNWHVVRDADGYGIDGRAIQLHGVRGPAAAANLLPGDILTHINGNRVTSAAEARSIVAGSLPGDTIELRARRPGGRVIDTQAVLAERLPPECG